MSSFPFVAFAGSRRLPASSRSLVQSVVRASVSAGRAVATGCAWGADAFVLECAARVAPRGHVQVFSAWSPACEQSERVLRFQSSGVSVRWLAGGGLSRPVVERLKARSKAMVSFASQSGHGAGLVMFVTGGWQQSPGSWFTAVHAIKSGLPVIVFPVGCSWACLPEPLSSEFPKSFWVSAGQGIWSQAARLVV